MPKTEDPKPESFDAAPADETDPFARLRAEIEAAHEMAKDVGDPTERWSRVTALASFLVTEHTRILDEQAQDG